jgi:hypothetical protein
VIESQCIDNLKEVSSLFSYYENDTAHCIHKLKFSPYVNVKDQSAQNSLHILAAALNADNFDVIFSMMKILIAHGCNANFPNYDQNTPFYIMLDKISLIKEAKPRKEILDHFLKHANVDFYTHKSDEIIEMVMNQKLKYQLPERVDMDVNYENMMQLLRDGDINTFETKFSLFKSSCSDSEVYSECCAAFLEIAVIQSLINIVDLLIEYGVDINRIPKGEKFFN